MAELRESTYFILAALIEGPQHGYAIAQTAGELSGGRVKLGAGTLYGALERLASEGLVEPSGEEIVAGRRRRHHRLTDAGETALAAEAQRLRSSAAVVESRLPAARAGTKAGASRRLAAVAHAEGLAYRLPGAVARTEGVMARRPAGVARTEGVA